MARVQGMTPEGIRKLIAEAISFIKDLDVEDLNKLLAAFEDANGIFDVRLVEAQEEVKKAGEKALEAEASARAIIEELEKYEKAQAEEVSRILGEVAVAIDAANLASAKVPGLLARLELAERSVSTANAEVEKFITKQDEFLAISQEQVTKVNDLNSGFQELNQAVDESVTKVDEANASLSLVSADLDAAKASLDAKMKQNELNISTAQAAADSNQNAISDLNRDLSGLSTKHEKLTSNFSAEVEKLEAADASLLTNMNTKVGDLNATTAAQSSAISAAKSQADKGVSDAATALAKANEANSKFSSITADVSAAAKAALEATNALPGIRTEITAAKQQADKSATDAADAKFAVDNLQIGGRNLLQKSKLNLTASDYNMISGTFGQTLRLPEDSPLVDDEEVTVSLKGQLGEGKTSFALYNSGGSYHITVLSQTHRGADGVYRRTIPWRGGASTSNSYVYVYQAPSSVTSESTIEWVKIERGNKATDWSPAPEDVDAGIATAQQEAGQALTLGGALANPGAEITPKLENGDPTWTVGKAPSTYRPSEAPTGGKAWHTEAFDDPGTWKHAPGVTYDVSFWIQHYSGDSGSISSHIRDQRGLTAHSETVNLAAGRTEFDGTSGSWNGVETLGGWRYVAWRFKIKEDPAIDRLYFRLATNGGNNAFRVYDFRIHSSTPLSIGLQRVQNESELVQAEINALNTKAGELTTGLAGAATQKQYNDLNTRLWGGQGEINKLQGDINANNSAFQTWQSEVNGRRDIWEKASTDATAALTRFAITQSQWNTLSATATDANTKALASHAALFEGQNKWNTVANAAIQAQATLLAKQDRWTDGVNKALAWQDQLNNAQSDINKTTKSVLANQGKWNSAQAEINNAQSNTNKAVKSVLDNQDKWNLAQAEVNNAQSVTNKAVKLVNDNQKKWNTAVSQALKAHDELFVTTTKTFKAVKAVTDNQGKWNKVVSDLVTTNSAVSNANKTAIEGLTRVLGITHSTSNIVPMVPGGVRTGGTDIAPVFTPTPGWMTKGTRVTVTDIPGISSIDAIQQTVQATLQYTPYYSEIDPTIEYKYSYWAKANKSDTRMYIEVRSPEGGGLAISNNTPDGHSSSGAYLAGNVLLAIGWKKYTGTIKFSPDVRSIWIHRVYYNHPNGVVGTQTLADIQIYPNMPSQTDVNKALLDSDKAQNLFDKNQRKWNDAASRSIATVENLWGKTAEDVGEISVLTEELGDKIQQQSDDFAKNITQLFTFIPRIAYAMDGQNVAASETDGFVKITRTKSGSRTTRVAVEAVGRWVGTMIIEGDHGQSGGQDQTFMNQTPIRLKQEVNSATRIFYLNRNTGSDHIGAVKVTFLVDPGQVVVQYPKGTNFVPDMDKWTTLHTQAITAAESTEHNLSLSATFSGTTYEDTYGVRIRVGNTVVAELKKSKIGPLFPGQNGTRVMSVQKAQVHIKSGTRIYLEAYSTGRDKPLRRVSKWNSQISYITSGRS